MNRSADMLASSVVSGSLRVSLIRNAKREHLHGGWAERHCLHHSAGNTDAMRTAFVKRKHHEFCSAPGTGLLAKRG
jgi:hypothetical protein